MLQTGSLRGGPRGGALRAVPSLAAVLLSACGPSVRPDDVRDVRLDVAPGGARGGRTWLVVRDTRALAGLPAGWTLLLDRNRFASVRVDVEDDRGVTPIERRDDALADSWSLGNYVALAVPVPGDRVRGVRVGYAGIDTPDLVRSVRALSPGGLVRHEARWTALVAAVAGVIACAFAYNLFLLAWLRTAFQRWYLLWLASALAYALVWSGAVNAVMPGLAGAAGVRASYLLIGLIVASGAYFFAALLEPGRLSPRAAGAIRWSAAAVLAGAVVAAADAIVPAWLGDRLLNVAFVACTAATVVGIVQAIRRGSRAVWFFLAGWTPALVVFALRVARNFGLGRQSEAVDVASLAIFAFEAITVSLAIADRSRALARDRDRAAAEREAMRRLATTDPLTGLSNRGAFDARLAEVTRGAAGADLVLLDLDRLKLTNDTAGHDAGDALLVGAARRLAGAAGLVGIGALVARIGGDEFAVLLSGDGRALLPALLAAVGRSADAPVVHQGQVLSLSFSAGHAAWAPGAGDAAWLYKRADLALYRDKAGARARWAARMEPAT